MADGIRLRVEVDDSRVRGALRRMQRAVRHPQPILDDVGRAMATETRQRFRSGTAPDGRPWKPVKRGGQPLRLTGRLARSITHRATDDAVEWGTNVAYAPYQQFGTGQHYTGPGGKRHTGPYTIRARTRRALAWGRGGKRRFAKSVQHPGIVARAFLGFTRRSERTVFTIFERAIRRAARA